METKEPQWATVELMGHAQTAGRVEMTGGLIRVDVPDGDTYRTEFYGMAAIYSIKIVSEEIARAYARRPIDILAFDAPIVTREQHLAAIQALQERESDAREQLRQRIHELENRLALPAPARD